MPKKIDFKEDNNKITYSVKPVFKPEMYISTLRLPAELGRRFQGKLLKVTIEEVKN